MLKASNNWSYSYLRIFCATTQLEEGGDGDKGDRDDGAMEALKLPAEFEASTD